MKIITTTKTSAIIILALKIIAANIIFKENNKNGKNDGTKI